MAKKPHYPQHELAIRLREAMEEADLNLAEMARGCGVTIQAVHDWRETGRIGKHHLVTISRLTRKPLEYFLVGLGRAAAVALVLFPLLLQPGQAVAGTLHNSFCADRILIICQWLKSLVFKVLDPHISKPTTA